MTNSNSKQRSSSNGANLHGAQGAQITQQQYKEQITLARSLMRAGKNSEAEAVALSLLQRGISSPALLNILGGSALAQGRYDDAVLRLKQAVVADPKNPDNHYNLAIAQQQSGQIAEAIQSYNRAVILKPDHVAANFQIVRLLQREGKSEAAIPFAIRLCAAQPHKREHWIIYMQIIRGKPLYEQEKSLRIPLEKILRQEIFPALRSAALRQVSLNDWAIELEKLFAGKNYAAIDEKLSDVEFIRKMQDPLLLNVMARSHIPSPVMEFILCRLRRQLLLGSGLATMAELRPLLLAMWQLCFINEYVFFAAEDELAALANLREKLQEKLQRKTSVAGQGEITDDYVVELALLGSYTPLADEDFADRLAALQEQCADQTISRILYDQVTQILADRKRAESIPALTTIEDEISRKVRAQYEKNPYPRWRELPELAAGSLEEYLQKNLLQHNWYELPQNPQKVLVAGCGTGQHALEVATQLVGLEVLAVDISLASLAYAQRKAEELSVKNIEFMQADILELGQIERRFDLIESVGVLHHMRDPLAGWRVLKELLRPGGVMKIGLYSSTARRAVNLARDEIKRLAVGDSDDAIRRYRYEKISNIGSEVSGLFAPGKVDIREIFFASDYYTLSECRDLLFHVHEHQFTLPQIKEAIAELELEFLGITRMDENQHSLFGHTLPPDDRSRDFELWHEYEQQHPDCFSAMYRFWVQKPE